MFTIGNGFCAASVCLQILNSFNISGMDDVIRSSNLANGSSNKPRPVPHCQAQHSKTHLTPHKFLNSFKGFNVSGMEEAALFNFGEWVN